MLTGVVRDFPALKIVLEHITTAEAADFVRDAGPNVGATITPQHLHLNRNALFAGGLRPHAYCLPVVKREKHRLAVRAAAVSGSPKFFLGTDSAPHPRHAKESGCGCAGIFNAPFALESYAQVSRRKARSTGSRASRQNMARASMGCRSTRARSRSSEARREGARACRHKRRGPDAVPCRPDAELEAGGLAVRTAAGPARRRSPIRMPFDDR